tara:strand:- start:10834 stop:12654 length:1821 start_codon:yes stop_codon:yes gene_type:complete
MSLHSNHHRAGKVVQPENILINELLANRFKIPSLQRQVSWGAPQVLELWKDLIKHYFANSSSDRLTDRPKGYFLGSAIFLKDDYLLVLDGQQRLVALTCMASIMLSVLKKEELIKKSDGEAFLELETLLSQMVHYSEAGLKPTVQFEDAELTKFLLASTYTHLTNKEEYWNTDPIAKKLLGPKSSPANKIRSGILKGEEELDKFLKNGLTSDDEKKQRFYSFARMFGDCISILKIIVTDLADAYDLFESLNSRGIDLSQSDLIKNLALKKASDLERGQITDIWNQIQNVVQDAEMLALPDFMHYSALSRGTDIKATQLFKATKSYIESNSSLIYVKRLKKDSDAYEALMNPPSVWDHETRDMLIDIRDVLGVKFAYVALLAGYRAYVEPERDDAKFQSYVRYVMNFCFRFMKFDPDATPVKILTALNAAALKVKHSLDPKEIAGDFKTYSSDEDFKQWFSKAGFSNTKLAYYIVYHLEKQKLSGTVPVSHGDTQHLEHIMPKSPHKSHWAAIKRLKASDPEIFKKNLWKIGNILALDAVTNKHISNREISYKISNPDKKDYTRSSLKMPTEIGSFLSGGADWDYAAIEKRQKDLAENWAVKTWSLD